jgi:hypothetical protein
MARNIFERLFEPLVVETGLRAYAISTGDYNLVDRMDTVPFAPTFNAATSTIDIFHCPKSRRLSFRLVDLFPEIQIGAILSNFADADITHGHIFTEKNQRDLSIFYLKALLLLPPNIAAQIVFWKRAAFAAEESMQPGRRHVWDMLWHQEFAALYCFHPAVFASLTLYKGPIPFFLQQVHAWMAVEIGPKALHCIYTEIVCRDWIITPASPRFLALWHRIMKESAVVYLPADEQTTQSLSALKTAYVGSVPYLRNSDKLLCLLLLLFHDTYRSLLARLLVEESQPPILADLFSRFPILQPR